MKDEEIHDLVNKATRDLRTEIAELRTRIRDMEEGSGRYATDRDLDGPYGNPNVKFPPRNWRGPDFTGKPYSQCPPEFLDMLAESLAYSAAHPKEGKEKFVKYNLIDAARARSWARRLRANPPAKAAATVGEFPGDPAPALGETSLDGSFEDDGSFGDGGGFDDGELF